MFENVRRTHFSHAIQQVARSPSPTARGKRTIITILLYVHVNYAISLNRPIVFYAIQKIKKKKTIVLNDRIILPRQSVC